MAYFGNVREEELKLKVGEAFFSNYDRTAILGNVDFCVAAKEEVEAKDKYASHFLLDYMSGKWQPEKTEEANDADLFGNKDTDSHKPLEFTPEALAVFDAARELWRYYHKQEDSNPNASFYDIREYFQGRNARGIMNPDSSDATYMALLDAFKLAYKNLSAQIEPKIYQYGFLLK